MTLIRKGQRRRTGDRRLAAVARTAGLIGAGPRGLPQDRTARATGRKIMILGRTGQSSFSIDRGELAGALRACRAAKIMLFDPREQIRVLRGPVLRGPRTAQAALLDQVMKSIACIRALSAPVKVRLKLYPDPPLFKLAFLGDVVYVRHYHPGHDPGLMPEFVFGKGLHRGGWYLPLYRYFLARWQDPAIPEYDFDTDELVYRDRVGAEVLREEFPGPADEEEGGGSGGPGYVFRQPAAAAGVPEATPRLRRATPSGKSRNR